ncbi:TetR/AcrR family transcriptional regulator [Streptomyces griseoruber]|uniref:TetR family transcriptional regulator n=1 Tax=Streptomyces griseoruber TaxID=1943 RepID=A0A101SLY2_9ACTN|nr:TetR/AcrR family transcriptional regulator [Streptomyces griseoruber]KUN76341.1 TetR family transcriptional regulator [Streptomyces griseoruber]
MARLRAAQKQMTRRLLLSTALELFGKHGYAGTTVDDIARAAGTTRVTFYAYFPSRTALMTALCAELAELTAEDTEALVGVVREGGRDGIGAWLAATAERWPGIRPYVLAAEEAAAVDAEVRELVEGRFEGLVADVRAALDGAARFDPGSRRMRGFLALAQLDRLARHWMRHGWQSEPETALGLLTDSWVQLLGRPTE